MVLLGGLELLAAGYILNEVNKEGKTRETDGEERRRRRRRERRDHAHRHEHRHDSPEPAYRPQQLQSVYSPPRPLSAPPPASSPMLNAQYAPGLMSQQRPQAYPFPPPPPPPLAQQAQGRPQQPQQPQRLQSPPYSPPQIIHPQSMPLQSPPNSQAHRPTDHGWYPPPGTYIDMKTGKIQHNMLPPGMMQDQARSRENANTGGWAPQAEGIPWQRLTHGNEEAIRSSPRLSSPPQGYSELDAETPGRYGRYVDRQHKSGPQHGYERMETPPPPYA